MPTVDVDGALTQDYTLTDEQIARFREDGHITLPEVAPLELLNAYRPRIDRLVEQFAETQAHPDDTFQRAFVQVIDAKTQDPGLEPVSLASRFGQIAAALLDVDGVRLLFDQVLYKMAGGGYTPWHNDLTHWPLDSDNAITMWIPLEDVTSEMGALEYATGSHQLRHLTKTPISDDSEAEFARLIAEHEFPVVSHAPLGAGDATLHAGWTLHRAAGNKSAVTRKALVLHYFAEGTRLTEPKWLRREDMEMFFPGKLPGEAAASHLTPLVYEAE